MPFAIPFAERTNVLLENSAAAASSLPITVSAPVRAAINDALDRGETHYTDRPGVLRLREKIALTLNRRFQIAVDPKNDIIVTCGVTEARFVAIQQLLKPGEILAAPAASDRIFGAARLRRAQVVDEVSANSALIYLTSSTPEAEIRKTLATVPPAALLLYEVDDMESRFHPAQVADFEDRTVTISGLGDESWRVGYLVSPSSFSGGLRDFKQALTICSTNLSQWAALAFEEQA
jgi:aspartate/methionine/tyrosine aminotransferase